MKTAFRTQLPHPLISVSACQHAQLCLRLWPLTSLPRTLLAGKPVASLQPGKRTSRLAGYSSPLPLPLSQFKFLATWSLKILSGGFWDQNPFHNDTRIWFFFTHSLMIVQWNFPPVIWRVMVSLLWCYYVMHLSLLFVNELICKFLGPPQWFLRVLIGFWN